MSVFSILLVLNLALLAVSLVRARPAALVIALNQVATLRALENIQLFGQPAAESFLPHLVFSARNLGIAEVIFTIATVMLGGSLLVSGPTRTRAAVDLPPLPKWVMGLLLCYFVVVTVSSGSLLTRTYLEQGTALNGSTFGGLNALLVSLLLYELARRTFIGQLRPLTAFLILSSTMFFTSYSKGFTGLATGVGITAAVMLWPREGRSIRRQTLTAMVMLGSIVLTTYVVRGVRIAFVEKGFSSVIDVLSQIGDSESDRAQTGAGIESAGNGTQYACHVLECVQLYESGIQRGWRSIYNPLIYTLEPSFLLAPLGLTRPLDAPWELADYFLQGGGIYIMGELYWNGGYFCLLVVFGALVLLSFYCDTRYRSSPFWLMMCAQFVPSAFMGVGYGMAQVSRGAINGLLVIGAYRLFSRRFRFKSGQPRFSIARPPPVPGTAGAGAAKPLLSET